MRNLKRALSLTLASVMLLGMMVVGSSALSFNDADDISNVTAATVLQELGVMIGTDKGDFQPEKPVTRAQMAILICRILYGEKLNVDQFAGVSQYSDVPANEYYTGHINLATSLGIINGYGNGKFGPDDTVTTAQAALMLCRALGYFQGGEIDGQSWAQGSLAAIAQATKIKMFGDLKLNTNEKLKRDNVAEMVFNTMTQAVPVMYNKNFDIYYNDSTAWTRGVVYNWRDTLGYKNFSLAYQRGEDDFNRPTTIWGTGYVAEVDVNDDGEINSGYTGITKDEQIIVVENDARYTYTAKVTPKTLYADLGRALVEDYAWNISFNGSTPLNYSSAVNLIDRTDNDTAWMGSATGRLVQIFVNTSDKIVDATLVDYYPAEVMKTSEDSVTLKQIRGDRPNPTVDTKVFDVANGEVAVGDIVLYTVSGQKIITIEKAKTVTGTVTAYQTKNQAEEKDSYAKLDDTKYKYSYNMALNLDDSGDVYPSGLGNEYTFYLDNFDNIIAFEGKDVIDNYLYVIRGSVNAAGVQAKVVFADGTQKLIDISKVKTSASGAAYLDATTWSAGGYGSANTIGNGVYSYVEDGNMYRLTALAAGTGDGEIANIIAAAGSRYPFDGTIVTTTGDKAYAIKRDHSRIFPVTGVQPGGANTPITWNETNVDSGFAINNATVFVDVADEEVYTGYTQVPSYGAMNGIGIYNNDGVLEIVFITAQDNKSNAGTYFFVKGESKEVTRDNKAGVYYYEYEVYIDGAKETMITKDFKLNANSLYKLTAKNKEDQLTNAELILGGTIVSNVITNISTDPERTVTSTANRNLVLSGGDSNYNNKTLFNWNDDTKFVHIQTKYNNSGAVVVDYVEPGDYRDIDTKDGTTATYIVTVNDKSNVAPTATLVYVVTQPENAEPDNSGSISGDIVSAPIPSNTASITGDAAGVKAVFGGLNNGAYTLDPTAAEETAIHAALTAWDGLAADTKTTDLVFFSWNTPAGDHDGVETGMYTLEIRSSIKQVYVETFDSLSDNAAHQYLCYVQVLKNGTSFGNKGDGSLKTSPLDPGTYTWTVSYKDGTVIASDSFEIGD